MYHALALFAVLGLHWALRPEPGERNLEALPGMVKSVPAEAFSESAVFADGKTLQPPPAGTVVRGLLPLHVSAIRLGDGIVDLVVGSYQATWNGAHSGSAWVFCTRIVNV